MRCEIPEFARCCFCFPLRFGLLAWAYTKLIFSILLLLILLEFIISEYTHIQFIKYGISLLIFVGAHSLAFIVVVDIAFLIICIKAAHTKDLRKMKIVYRESIGALVAYVMAFVFVIVTLFISLSFFAFLIMRIIWAFSFWIIIMQAYIIIIVRSEILKWERNMNYQFVNLTQEQIEKVDVNEIEDVIKVEDSSSVK